MAVAQGQEQSPKSRTLSRLSPGPTASTKATSTSTRTATVLLPSFTLILTLSCLLSPVVPVQAAVSASVVVDAAALPLSFAACGNPLLAERTRTLTTVHGLGCTPNSQFLASLVAPDTSTDPDGAALDQQKEGVSPRSTFVIDRMVVPAIGVIKERWMGESEDLIHRKPPGSRGVSDSSVGGETTLGIQSSSPLVTLPHLNWIRTHLGTKSPYPHESRPVGPLKDVPEGYELVQLQLICRHGTRYPSASKAVGFKKLADRLRGVNLPGFEWIKDWPSDTLYPPARGNLLSVQGDADLYQIGRRFAIRYKTLLDKYPYDASLYQFTTSAKSRSSQSAYGFSIGFFESRFAADSGSDTETGVIGDRPIVQPIDISMLPIGLDKELAMKYACPRWLESIKNQPRVVRESKGFEGKFVPALADRLSAVLSQGAESPAAKFNITVKDIGVIQNMCGFEVALHNNDTTWCRLLGLGLSSSPEGGNYRDDEVKDNEAKDVFLKYEIAGDLDDYYSHGPGVPFNRHLGCKLGTSMMEAVELALTEGETGGRVPKPKEDNNPGTLGSDDDDGEPGVYRALLKFGHSETILFFSSFLGLYNQKGIPLTADMTSKQYAEREFRTSKVSPFAANMAFEVYRPIADTRKPRRRLDAEAASPADSNTKSAPRGLIRLLVNEVPMVLPGCGGEYFCEWPTFKKVLQRAGTGCDFDGCCSTLTKPTPTPGAGVEGKAKARAAFLAAVWGFRHQTVLERKSKPKLPVCLAVDPVIK
ncbi:PHOsphatase [Mortierella hygrophila]|uniref:Multiple inositol polyphosphate phosphatase 1 n=1 Tax=Mortierella hygrophila TaxID=979708 RepID=A0A9P6F9L7_9FUNG|nr:PHOsphatase [Mortierella hygrophila]